ncbi:MAG: acetyl-CoA carboxylase biotin carboxyl carrier protein subunit [Oscillospiraceae bacterium]|nr:acetyl-CoA carboxylase biotin carboxyl carrier protein subunit [Oscillospiraceae bacterium]
MKNYKITINGKTYDVGVEDGDVSAPIKSVQPVQAKAAPAPAPKAAPAVKAAPAPAAAGSGDVTAPMAGTVLSTLVSVGDTVQAGQAVLIFEAMKMETEITATIAGTVKKIHVAKGDLLENGTVVVTIG